MLAKVDHAWRWFGTAFSFLIFGVGGVITPLFIVPVLCCLPGDGRAAAIASAGVDDSRLGDLGVLEAQLFAHVEERRPPKRKQ